MSNATEWNGRVVEVDYQTSKFLVRYEGVPPDVGTDLSQECTAVQANAEMLAALRETDIDFGILLCNIREASSRDPKWEGMEEVVRGWRERNRAAISYFKEQQK